MHFFLCVSVSGQDNSDEIAGHVCQNCLSQRKVLSAKQFIVDFAEDYGQRTLPATSSTLGSQMGNEEEEDQEHATSTN